MSNYDSVLEDILQQTAQLKKRNGYNYGKPTHEVAGGDIAIYWEDIIQTIIDKGGNEITSDGFGIVLPTVDIEAEDIIVDPNGNERLIMAVLAVPDPEGKFYPHHKEVYV